MVASSGTGLWQRSQCMALQLNTPVVSAGAFIRNAQPGSRPGFAPLTAALTRRGCRAVRVAAEALSFSFAAMG